MARRAADAAGREAAYGDLDEGVRRASHLVDQLLTLARIEPEAMEAEAVDCDLVDVAKDAIVGRAALAADKGVDLGLAQATPARGARQPGDARHPAVEPARQRAALHAGRRPRGRGESSATATRPC